MPIIPSVITFTAEQAKFLEKISKGQKYPKNWVSRAKSYLLMMEKQSMESISKIDFA